MEGYRFERLSESKLPDLQYLYKDAFLTDVSLEFLKMKYDTSFTGIQYVGYIAYDTDNKPAAYYGVFPLFAEHKDQSFLAAQSGDTMTHSAHRGKGLFYNLANETYKLAAGLGIKFVYGFPNLHNSYHGLMKLKWTHIGNMQRYRVFVPAIPLSAAAGKFRSLENTYKNRVNRVLSEYASEQNSFPNPLPKNEYVIIRRDTAYFEYKKYFKKHIIEVGGKCVYVKADKTLLAGDIEKCSEEEFYGILSVLKKIAFRIGAPAVTFRFSPSVDYCRFLEKKYKPSESLPVCYLNLTDEGIELDKLRFSLADFDTF